MMVLTLVKNDRWDLRRTDAFPDENRSVRSINFHENPGSQTLSPSYCPWLVEEKSRKDEQTLDVTSGGAARR